MDDVQIQARITVSIRSLSVIAGAAVADRIACSHGEGIHQVLGGIHHTVAKERGRIVVTLLCRTVGFLITAPKDFLGVGALCQCGICHVVTVIINDTVCRQGRHTA